MDGYELVNIEGMINFIKKHWVVIILTIVFVLAIVLRDAISKNQSWWATVVDLICSLIGGYLGSYIIAKNVVSKDVEDKIKELKKPLENNIIDYIAKQHDSETSARLEEVMKATKKNWIESRPFSEVFPECCKCVTDYLHRFDELVYKHKDDKQDSKHLMICSWKRFHSFDSPIDDAVIAADEFRKLQEDFKKDATAAIHKDLFVN